MGKILLFALLVFVISSTESSEKREKERCPFVEESDLHCKNQFITDCIVDSDCNATMKCCRTACHQYRCFKPLKTKVCQTSGDIVLLMDSSGSIKDSGFKKTKSLVKKILEKFPQNEGHRLATIVYGKKPSVVFNFIDQAAVIPGTENVIELVDKIPFYKSHVTRMVPALHLAKKIFIKSDEHKAKMLVLFTDGYENWPPHFHLIKKYGERLWKMDVKVFVVFVGEPNINIKTVLELCPDDRFIFTAKLFDNAITTMANELEHPC